MLLFLALFQLVVRVDNQASNPRKLASVACRYLLPQDSCGGEFLFFTENQRFARQTDSGVILAPPRPTAPHRAHSGGVGK